MRKSHICKYIARASANGCAVARVEHNIWSINFSHSIHISAFSNTRTPHKEADVRSRGQQAPMQTTVAFQMHFR